MRIVLLFIFFLAFSSCRTIKDEAIKNCKSTLGFYHFKHKTSEFISCVNAEYNYMRKVEKKYSNDCKICRNNAETIYPILFVEVIRCYDESDAFTGEYNIEDFVKENPTNCFIKRHSTSPSEYDKHKKNRQAYIKKCLIERGWKNIPKFFH
ncbi:MAG: hypothetical protein J0H68_08035 [Sphingobacteriia bacterium]|nr:hypothetical protein [Sphingobacteriia bacterium]